MDNKITEQSSHYDQLESMSTKDLLSSINQEDHKVAQAVTECLPQIEVLVNQIYARMKDGGRLYYIGAGTSGRLGVLDASECPPTYGVSPELVQGIIAGGDTALRTSVENAEDDTTQAYKDLMSKGFRKGDSLIGIAASGTTPYVIGGVNQARSEGYLTGCITCNPASPLSKAAKYPITCVVGPEFVTGSTRMKSGTAQKMILNMISTSLMIKLGRVKGNKMVDMKISNDKLKNRGIRQIVDQSGISEAEAERLLLSLGSVRQVLDHLHYY